MNVEQVTTKRGHRYYKVDGEKVPSVTTILGLMNKPALVPWASKVVAEYSIELIQKIQNEEITTKEILALDLKDFIKKAKNRPEEIKKAEGNKGQRVHEFAHRLFKSMLDEVEFGEPIPDDLQEPCEALIEWIKKHSVTPIAMEQGICSVSITPFAGTFDLIARIDGKLLVIDVKTSKGIYQEMPLQVAGYDLGYRENTEQVTDGTGILRLDKETAKPDFVMWDRNETEKNLKEFLHWAMIYNMRKERKEERKEKKKSLPSIPKSLKKEPF